jgi:hypothetical protein
MDGIWAAPHGHTPKAESATIARLRLTAALAGSHAVQQRLLGTSARRSHCRRCAAPCVRRAPRRALSVPFIVKRRPVFALEAALTREALRRLLLDMLGRCVDAELGACVAHELRRMCRRHVIRRRARRLAPLSRLAPSRRMRRRGAVTLGPPARPPGRSTAA